MAKDFWDFIGVSGSSVGEADRLRDELMDEIFCALDLFLGTSHQTYQRLDDMIQDGIQRNDRYAYFWAWFQDHGHESLRRIYSFSLKDDDEVLGCLDECQFMLQSDKENGLADAFFESVAAAFTAIENVLSAYRQTSASAYSPLTDTSSFDYWISVTLTYTEGIKPLIIQDSVASVQRSFVLTA